MMRSRSLAHAVLALLLAAGCSQSLFDANPERDGGPLDRIDASQPDARDDDGPDAGNPVLDCPVSDCVGDAVGEFAMDQDGPWRYVEVQPGADGFTEMDYDGSRTPPGWVGDDLTAASIVNCDRYSQVASCSGLENRILLQPSVLAAAPRPGLAWTAPETGTYRLTIDWRLDDTQIGAKPATVLLVRNSQLDRVLTTTFDASTAVGTFPQGSSVDIDAKRGDSIALALAGDTPTPLGVSFYVSDLRRNDSCQMAISLEGPDSFPNACADDGGAFVESSSQSTTAAAAPPGIPGVARSFLGNELLQYQGAVNDYSGDWTMQFWAKLEGAGEVLSDLSCTNDGTGVVAGGVSMRFDGDAFYITAGAELLIEDCAVLPEGVVITRDVGFAPEDWHFYRLVRSPGDTRLDVCMDGVFFDTLGIPSDATMVTDRVMEIGNRPDTPESSFTGQIADLRLYDRALPCLPVP